MRDKPQRIQRKRTKGWRMPANTVYVGRPTKWGNPYKVGDKFMFDIIDRSSAVYPLFESYIYQKLKTLDIKELQGKNLACWCPLDKPCHADILIKLANKL